MTPAPKTDSSLSTYEAPPALRERPADHPLAPGFVENVHDFHFRLASPWSRVWEWLETPETFVDGQVWPYRVEFLSTDPAAPAGFHEGGLNLHHGPLLSLPGRLDTIEASTKGAYRSLSYLYGSYVLSLRSIRPTRLEFWVEEHATQQTLVRLRLSSDVHPLLETPWSRLQGVFWTRLAGWMSKALDAERLD